MPSASHHKRTDRPAHSPLGTPGGGGGGGGGRGGRRREEGEGGR